MLDPSLRVPVPAACLDIPGIAASAATARGFTYTTAQIQSVTGLLGGNPDLPGGNRAHPDPWRGLHARVPAQLHALADYYRIKVKDAVGIIDQNTSVREYIETDNPLFCDNVIRDSGGFITAVNALNLNTGSFTVEGIDIEARYRTSLDGIGLGGSSLDFDLFWNHLLKQEQVPFPGADPQPEKGQLDCYSCGRLAAGSRTRCSER